jgi:hypothetical protein
MRRDTRIAARIKEVAEHRAGKRAAAVKQEATAAIEEE